MVTIDEKELLDYPEDFLSTDEDMKNMAASVAESLKNGVVSEDLKKLVAIANEAKKINDDDELLDLDDEDIDDNNSSDESNENIELSNFSSSANSSVNLQEDVSVDDLNALF